MDRILEPIRVACYWAALLLVAVLAAVFMLAFVLALGIGILLMYVVDFLTPRGAKYR